MNDKNLHYLEINSKDNKQWYEDETRRALNFFSIKNKIKTETNGLFDNIILGIINNDSIFFVTKDEPCFIKKYTFSNQSVFLFYSFKVQGK